MIDEKISFEFLKAAYFGYYDGCDSYALAGRRAYRDMCRTIEFPETGRSRAEAKEYEERKMELRRRVIGWLREEVPEVAAEEFDAWHESMCERIIALYGEEGIGLAYGQAQKWVNMFFKYMCVLEPGAVEPIFDKLHIPIDGIIIGIAVKNKVFKRPVKAWSRWSKEEYLGYRARINDYIAQGDWAPMAWEFRVWRPE